MRTIRIKKYNYHLEYKNDINLIQESLIDKGFYATAEQCVDLWETYSSLHSAGWLYVQDFSKQEIYDCVKYFFEASQESSLDTKFI